MKADNRKNRIKSGIRLSAMTLVMVVLAACLSSCKPPAMKNTDPNTVRGTVSPLNCTNDERGLYVCNDTLFVFISRTLYEIQNDGTFRKIFFTSNASTGFFLGNGFFYYINDQSTDALNSWVLKRYDLKTGNTETVASKIEKASYFISRGNAMILLNGRSYAVVTEKADGAEMLSYEGPYNEEYSLGKSRILVEYDYSRTIISKLTDDGEEEIIHKEVDFCTLMKISDNSLLVNRRTPPTFQVVDFSSRALSWIIDSDGVIHELIKPEGYAMHTGNYCKNYYYCSFYRFKEVNRFSYKKFDNDKLEGTWKVNVETFEQTKISDKIYDDIFVIGDKVIGVDSSRTFSIIDKG